MFDGSSFQSSLSALSADAESFLHSRGYDASAVVQSLLQVICSTREEHIRLQALSALQQQSATLLGDDASAQEHALTSLEALFMQSMLSTGAPHSSSALSLTAAASDAGDQGGSSAAQSSDVFKGQIVVTMTVLLLQHSFFRSSRATFERIVQLFLRVISRVNSPADAILRSFACQALRELEQQLPGLLAQRCNHILLMLDGERTHVRDAYASLYACVLRNTSLQLAGIADYYTSIKEEDNKELDETESVDLPPAQPPHQSASPLIQHRHRWQSILNSTTATNDTLMVSVSRHVNAVSAPGEEQQRAGYILPQQLILSSPLSLRSLTSTVTTTTADNTNANPTTQTPPLLSDSAPFDLGPFSLMLRRGTTVLLDSAAHLSGHNLVLCILSLAEALSAFHVSPVVLKQQYHRLSASHCLFLTHTVLLLKARFQSLLVDQSDTSAILSRLTAALSSPLVGSLESRLLLAHWLSAFPSIDPSALSARLPFLAGKVPVRNPSTKQIDASLQSAYRLYTRLFPTTFDSPQLVEARLCAIAKGFVPIGRGDALSRGASVPAAQCLRDCRAALHGYHHDPPRGRRIMALLRVTHCYGREFSRALRASVHAATLELVLDQPRFAPSVIELIDSAARATSSTTVFAGLLASLVGALTAMPPSALMDHACDHLVLLERAACDSEINPAGFLRALLAALRLTTVCASADWTVGNHFLSVCRAALATHAAAEARMAVSDILRVLLEQHGDVDIRDRAHFYLMLLTHATGDRLTRILTLPRSPTDISALTQTTANAAVSSAKKDETDRIDSGGETPQQPTYMSLVEGAPTSAPTEFPRVPSVVSTHHQLLVLERRGSTRPYLEESSDASRKKTERKQMELRENQSTEEKDVSANSEAANQDQMLLAYLCHVASESSLITTTIAVPCAVRLIGDSAELTRITSELFGSTVSLTHLCAVSLSFSVVSTDNNDPNSKTSEYPASSSSLLCDTIPPVTLPLVTPATIVSTQVLITPWEPTPLTLDIRATFTATTTAQHTTAISGADTNAAATVSCSAGQMHIHFVDLFLPPMFPPSVNRLTVFLRLWAHLSAPSARSPLTNEPCVQSVKRIRSGNAKSLLARARVRLDPFLIESKPTSEEHQSSSAPFCAMVFLSPTYHLLFHFCEQGDSMLVRFVTDHWKILGRVDAFLETL